MVLLHEEMLTYNGEYMYEPWPGPNNFIICDQKHKVWVLVFLVRREEHFEIEIEQIRRKFSVLQQNHS